MAIWCDGEGRLPIGQIVLFIQSGGNKKMLVCGQAVILVPSPTPFPPIFLFLNLFNMAPEIEFALSDFPPSHKTASFAG